MLTSILKYWPAIIAVVHVIQAIGSGNPTIVGNAVLTLVSVLGLNHIAVQASSQAAFAKQCALHGPPPFGKGYKPRFDELD